jgi:biotin-[acetyl-CoA-carboxylase] ligase BirA-like protein
MIVHRYGALESTNLQLMKIAEGNAPVWTVVLADSQESGMGRSGRVWWSPPGGLYMSVLVRPPNGIRDLYRLPVLSSLAVLDAVGATETPLRVKWPNDILSGEKKLAGILIQARTDRRRVHWIVAGFGVNMRRPECEIPVEIRDRIAFLEDLRGDITRDRLAEAIVSGLRERLDALDDAAWKRAMDQWTRSNVQRPTSNVKGTPRSKAENLALRVRIQRNGCCRASDIRIQVLSKTCHSTKPLPNISVVSPLDIGRWTLDDDQRCPQ